MEIVLNFMSVDLVSAVVSSASVMIMITMMCNKIGSLALSRTGVDENLRCVKMFKLSLVTVNDWW